MEKLIQNDAQPKVWDRLIESIDAEPCDGIDAEGVFNKVVQREQCKFIDGMRSARLAAIYALAPFNTQTSGGPSS